MKKIFFIAALILISGVAYAEEPVLGRPLWSFEMKGGTFKPALPNWKEFFGRKDMPEYSLSLAYKFIRQAEIGIGASYMTKKGSAYAPLHQMAAGQVTYTLYPVEAFVLLRGIINEKQWFVPYVGGGYTRIYYRESIEGQGSVKGSADGYHARGGLQILLDALDEGAANNMYLEYGVFHTYLFVEAKYSRAVVSSYNLGGTSYLAGLLFEF